MFFSILQYTQIRLVKTSCNMRVNGAIAKFAIAGSSGALKRVTFFISKAILQYGEFLGLLYFQELV